MCRGFASSMFFFFSNRRRHTGCGRDWSSDVCSSDLAIGGVEGLSAARLSAIADLQGMTSGLDWYLDRVVHFNRPDPLTIEYDIVRATADLRPDCLVRQLQRCRHRPAQPERGVRRITGISRSVFPAYLPKRGMAAVSVCQA